MDAKLLSDFIVSKRALDAAKEANETARDAILADMQKRGAEKEVNEVFGSFTRAHKPSWTYSQKIKTLTEKLKIAKIKEEDAGIAKKTIVEYIVYTPPKENA